ncbi:MAG: hypothetical protein ACKORL_09325, partial [Phycisphaerales bacterium]
AQLRVVLRGLERGHRVLVAAELVLHAKEAAELCSAIVRKNIAFRDVRARRKEVDELVRTLG